MILHRQVFMNIKIAKKIVFSCMLVGMTCFLNATEVTPKDIQSENSFIQIVAKASSEYKATSNEIKKEKIIAETNKLLCKLGKGTKIKKWIGYIAEISKFSPNKAGVLIQIPNKPGESKNSLSFGGGGNKIIIGSYIYPNTAVYSSISNMEKGDIVYFSGFFPADRCIKITNNENLEEYFLFEAEVTDIKSVGGNFYKILEKATNKLNESKKGSGDE